MIKLEHTEVLNLEGAVRGLRNPMNSWDKSDSYWGCETHKSTDCDCSDCLYNCRFMVGKNDLDLMKKLAKAGSDHRKFMRQIMVSVDITAPLYWWKEFDTYKVGTVANSCSTMHKIHERKLVLDDFSYDRLAPICVDHMVKTIGVINHYRELYVEEGSKSYWYQMIQLLPSSYNQKRTVTMNYEVLRNMYYARKNHKLDEWLWLCEWIEGLPYSEIITGEDE